MARSISELFMNRFMDKNDLYPVLEYVKADNSLDLEMRGNYVSIYYRGGSVLRIFEDKGHYGSIDPRYMPGAQAPQFSLENIHAYLTEAKHIVDIYTTNVKNHLGEKDIQQMIIKENVFSTAVCPDPWKNECKFGAILFRAAERGAGPYASERSPPSDKCGPDLSNRVPAISARTIFLF